MIGKFINKYIKSYGSTFMFIRRPLVNWICKQIAQIDEQEYHNCRNTGAYRSLSDIKKLNQEESKHGRIKKQGS